MIRVHKKKKKESDKIKRANIKNDSRKLYQKVYDLSWKTFNSRITMYKEKDKHNL